ncbi:bifunctional diguanylate cyclase/phosphodiesterase [Thalassiella azotivora]
MSIPAVGRTRPVDLARVLEGQRALLDAEPGDVLAVLAEEVRHLVGADSVVVSTPSQQQKMLVRAVAGSHCEEAEVGDLVEPSGGLAALALRTGAAQVTGDLGLDPRLEPARCRQHAHGSCVSVPLRDDGVVVGVVSAYATGSHAFTDVHQRLVEVCSRVVSTALGQALAAAEGEQLRSHLSTSRRRLLTAQRMAGFGWWETDLVTGHAEWSEEIYGLLGLDPSFGPMPLREFLEFVHPEDVHRLPTRLDEVDGDEAEFSYRLIGADGVTRLVHGWMEVERDDDGVPVRTFGTAVDITRRREAEQERESTERLFRVAFDHAPIGMVITSMHPDHLGVVLRANDAVCRMLGVTPEQVVGRSGQEWVHPDDRTDSLQLRMAVAGGVAQDEPAERRLLRSDGEVRHVLMQSAAFEDSSPQSPYVLTHMLDMTDTMMQRAELERLALTDTLTGLSNRSVVERRVAAALDRLRAPRRSGEGVALLLLDLDRFKLVNDSLGHGAGDTLLVETAQRLRSVVREPATVGRLGGDEFVVVLEQVADVEAAGAVAARIVETLREPVRLRSGRQIVCTTSVGLAVATAPGRTGEDMLREADLALYRAKDQGRDRYAVYDDDLRARAVGRMETENRLRRALKERGLRMHLQPLVDLQDGERTVTGHEALVRIVDPVAGVLPPLPFIEVAEETGLIIEVDFWMLEEAVRLLGDDPDGSTSPRIAVNMSGRTLEQVGFADLLRAMLEEYGVAGDRLSLEITERVLLEGGPGVEETVQQVRGMGVLVGLDDFGTGYSALTHLQRFDLDFLKIDRSFVATMEPGSRSAAMIKAVIDLAHALRLTVVAEGVEDEEHAVALTQMGCDHGQGWLFGRPQPAPGS